MSNGYGVRILSPGFWKFRRYWKTFRWMWLSTALGHTWEKLFDAAPKAMLCTEKLSVQMQLLHKGFEAMCYVENCWIETNAEASERNLLEEHVQDNQRSRFVAVLTGTFSRQLVCRILKVSLL